MLFIIFRQINNPNILLKSLNVLLIVSDFNRHRNSKPIFLINGGATGFFLDTSAKPPPITTTFVLLSRDLFIM